MPDLNARVDSWKNKLLDTGLRNKLLNYHETKRSTLHIKNPDIYSLWDSFVINEKPLVFPLVSDDGNEDEAELALPENITDITDQSPSDRQATLRNLRNKSKSFIEEQGINALYLSFGFLRWTEAGHSNDRHNAPLILVPVTLKWDSITSPFVLELHEDEIVLNPTLVYKMENDFGLKLPEFDPDAPLEDYFSEVEKVTAPNRWSVLREVSLGMLSFLKINMYQDLETHRETIVNNPVIRAICGDNSGIINDISDVDHYDFDHKTKPGDMFQVVDADSSQQDAILCAKKGISFVLQGPPGTGKSQTITNIIAECLADGKKVLFVSEKMAALDVVYNRLADVGLSDFCLVLHSYKANKKQTLDQLGDVLALADKKVSVSEDAYRSLERLSEDRDELNRYSEEVYEIVEPLHKSIYEANGILSNTMEYEDVIFAIPDVRQTTAQKYSTYINLLQDFTEKIGMQECDYHINPWRGATSEYITNELRQDISVKIDRLKKSVSNVTEMFNDICSEFMINMPDRYVDVEKLLTILNMAAEGVSFEGEWISQNEINYLLQLADSGDALKTEFSQKRRDILDEIQNIHANDSSIVLNEEVEFTDSEALADFASSLNNIIKTDGCYCIWADKAAYDHFMTFCDEAESTVNTYNDLKKQILDEYEKEIMDIPVNDIYFRFRTGSKSAFKFLNSQYKADRNLIQSMYHGTKKKLNDEDITDVLTLIREMNDKKSWIDEHHNEFISVCPGYCKDELTDFGSLREHAAAFDSIVKINKLISELQEIIERNNKEEENLKAHFNQFYSGIETDWGKVRISLEWTGTFASVMGELVPKNAAFIERLSSDQNLAGKCGTYASKLKEYYQATSEDYKWFIGLFENSHEFDQMRLPVIADRLSACAGNFSALEEWIDFKHIRKQCCDNGLGEYIEALEEENIAQDHIVPAFKKRFFRLWLDSVLPEYPAVANFRRKNQEKKIGEFCQLDKMQFKIASSRIRYKLIDSLPSMDHFTSGADEMSILRRELNKQRKIMPVRKLFNEIPDVIMTLKPCLMMSPLSVSLYLESDSYVFDTVIFDEASQVFTEDAIGAICRGKQVIIAGDSRQLPPTSFFMAASGNNDFNDDEYEDGEDSDAFESILDEAALLPERTLLWHYRSKHEHLIAFSNAKIYHNNLITFPSSVDKAKDMGVEYIYVKDGYYDRGGRKGNVIEAQRVAKAVFEHFKEHPERSLGVITFGQVQQSAIDTALRKMRLEHPEYDPYFRDDRKEPFFVKSLENVQGDERDTIILSIGYGKDIHGIMRMNFGPLSAAGGERRLNVAVTRAKYNVKLIGSIESTDLNLSNVTTEGPKLLKSYIEFAKEGPSSLANEITENDETRFESPFEESVYNYLDRRRYKLATQVGCSGYRIDIAVKHNKLEGRYVLGIECDGATYHSARTARERDRLRQDVLESIGWKIYRIWSTDWIKDPVTEGRRLTEAIDEAMAGYHEDEPANAGSAEENGQTEEFLRVEDKPVNVEDSFNPYHFDSCPDIMNISGANVTDCIMNVIEAAYPVHLNDICKAAAPLLFRDKVTSVVKNSVLESLYRMRWKYTERDGFYFPASCNINDLKHMPHRLAGKRTIKYISTLELASGMLAVAETCIGTTKDGLIAETIRAFGFNRNGNNIMAAMNDAYALLLEDHYINVVNNKVKVDKG